MARSEKDYHVRVFIDPPGPHAHEKIFVKELAAFLRIGMAEVLRFARRNGFLHRALISQRPDVHWVTPNGAQRIILHVRLLQQRYTETHGGRCWFGKKERDRLAKRAHRERMALKAKEAGKFLPPGT